MREQFSLARLAVFAAGFCSFLDLYATQALLPVLRDAFGATKAAVGLTVSASTFAVALVAPLTGALADRWGRKRMIVGGALLMTLPTALAGLSDSITMLIIMRFLQGLALPAVFAVTAAHVVEQWPGRESADVAGLQMVGMILGGFSGRFLTALIAEYYGWRWGFPLLALLNLGGALILARWLPADSPRAAAPCAPVAVAAAGTRSGGALAGMRAAFAHRPLLATCMVGVSLLFSNTAVFTWINFVLEAPPFSLGIADLGKVFFVYVLGAPMAGISGWVLRRFGRRRGIAAALSCVWLGLILSHAASLPVVLLGLTLIAGGTFLAQPLAIGYAGLALPQARGLAVGLYVCSYYIGGSLGGVVPALLWASSGWLGCTLLVAAVEVLALTLVLRFWPRAGQAGG